MFFFNDHPIQLPPPPRPIKIADIFTEILLELTYALSFLVLLDGLSDRFLDV